MQLKILSIKHLRELIHLHGSISLTDSKVNYYGVDQISLEQIHFYWYMSKAIHSNRVFTRSDNYTAHDLIAAEVKYGKKKKGNKND